MSGLRGILALNHDVIIMPVAELSNAMRTQAGCLPSDYALSRTRGRMGSSIIDADSVSLLERFREPRSVVDAVILYAREKHSDAAEVLEHAYPFLEGMVQRRILVAADALPTPSEEGSGPWAAGTRFPFGEIVRTVQALDDSEVYQITRPDGERAILKVECDDSGRLRHEARVLRYLNGRVGPRMLEDGEVEARYYLVIEMIEGVDVAAAMQDCREQPLAARQRAALGAARAICSAYVKLHALDVVHGDVHPRNILMLRDRHVRLIDFGFASAVNDGAAIPRITERGGVPFFFEPEFARAALDDSSAPQSASVAGEQFAVGALMFLLATGEYWQRFRLGRHEMLFDIANGSPRSFVECGSAPWPAFERILGRALARDPDERWPSMAEMASAFDDLPTPETRPSPHAATVQPQYLERTIRGLRLDGPLFGEALPAPSASINFGAAGIALGALHIAQRRAAPELLAVADSWSQRALREIDTDGGFYNIEIDISRAVVGEASPYHTPSGVHAVNALLARASGDSVRQYLAVAQYLECARRPAAGLDLTLGRSSTLLGAAILLDALPRADEASEGALRAFGAAAVEEIWEELNGKERVGARDIPYLGIAHGWAGLLYATLTWCHVSKVAVPVGVERRVDELAALALASGRGLEWAWTLGQPGDPPTMPGWCNGSCGYVFLWTLAHQMFGHERYLDAAVGAAWNSWESLATTPTLCCGLAGRGYALLRLYRHTGEGCWLDRALRLCRRAEKESVDFREHPHSLYKGVFGVAILAADLEDPEWGRMPFFEPAGYRE